MSYREVSVIEVREVLRAWLSGVGLRTVAAQAGVDRKTVRRYVAAAEVAGVVRNGDVGQLSDEVIGAVVTAVRPVRPEGHGTAWQLLVEQREQIEKWVGQDLTVVKIGDLLARRGVVVPYRTLHRFCVECCGFGRSLTTVRVADGDPGVECQIDFARMGLVHDPATGRRRVAHALIFTAVCSRHTFVWLTYSQTLAAVIAGCEAAWEFFGGCFKVLVPDNMSAIVADADAVNPRFTTGGQGAGGPTRTTCPSTPPAAPCATWTASWPPPTATAAMWASTRNGSSTTSCPGPGCGRSTGCSPWSAAMATHQSTRPAAGHWRSTWCR